MPLKHIKTGQIYQSRTNYNHSRKCLDHHRCLPLCCCPKFFWAKKTGSSCWNPLDDSNPFFVGFSALFRLGNQLTHVSRSAMVNSKSWNGAPKNKTKPCTNKNYSWKDRYVANSFPGKKGICLKIGCCTPFHSLLNHQYTCFNGHGPWG